MRTSSGAVIRHPTKSPAKIVNPLDMYAKQQLEEARSRKAAWDAAKPARDAAEGAMRAREEIERKTAAERAAKNEETKVKNQIAMEVRMELLHKEYAAQQAAEVSHPLTVDGCATFVRPEEMCFFHDHHVPRPAGFFSCSTCKREKQPKLRHEPKNPVDGTFPCFMCSKPVGWVFYCPDCSWKRKL